MVRLAVAGVFVLAGFLTIAAWMAHPQAQSSTATTTGTATATTPSTPAGSTVQPSFGGGTFLGTPGSDTIRGTAGSNPTTFLGVPTTFPTGATATTGAATTSTATTTTSTTSGADVAGALLPYTILYTPGYAYQPVVGVPQAAATPIAPGTTGGFVAVPVGTAGTLVPGTGTAPGQPGRSSRTAAPASPAPAVPTVRDDVLLRQAQEQLYSSAGLRGRAFEVDVYRGIIRVTTHGLTAAERDRIFLIARDVPGSIGVIVTGR